MPYYAKRDDHVVIGERHIVNYTDFMEHTYRLAMILHTVAIVMPVYKGRPDIPEEARQWSWAENVKVVYWCNSKKGLLNWFMSEARMRPMKRHSANVLLSTVYGNKLGLRR